jgi:transaldolase
MAPELEDTMTRAEALRVKIFADGADVDGIRAMAADPLVQGFTTNPTLMRKAGIENYEQFAREVLTVIDGKPISFEVFSDDFEEMAEQAMKIASWGPNVFVKIPVSNSVGVPSDSLLRRLAAEGVRVNVTALMTTAQVATVVEALDGGPASCVSVFAGRIADTGVDPLPTMVESLRLLAETDHELIWASPREVLNIVQADDIGCDIITVTNDLIAKLGVLGRDLDLFSLETVQMFRRDAEAAGFSL